MKKHANMIHTTPAHLHRTRINPYQHNQTNTSQIMYYMYTPKNTSNTHVPQYYHCRETLLQYNGMPVIVPHNVRIQPIYENGIVKLLKLLRTFLKVF